MFPSLQDLLSQRATLLHSTRRSYFEKRIVEFTGKQYVLYRLPNLASAQQLVDIIESALAAGANLQQVVAHPVRTFSALRWRSWVALSYIAGEPLHGKHDNPAIFSSLGKNLAILHRQRAQRPGALLHAPPVKPELDAPYKAPSATQWLAESRKRLANLREYRLIHGDLYAGNIIVTPDNNSALIDYELFAYDLPGIELGTLLLRHVCRIESKRQTVLDAYLEYCDPETRHLWNTHWQDFLVAAALHISAQRKRRQSILQRRHAQLSRIMHIPLPSSLWSSLAKHLETQSGTMESARKGHEQHQELASKLITFIIQGSDTDANALINRCFLKKQAIRKPQKPVPSAKPV